MICSPRVGKLKQCRKAWITLELVLASMDRYSVMYSPVSRNRKRGLMLFLVGRRGTAGIAKPVEGPKRALAKNPIEENNNACLMWPSGGGGSAADR